MSEINPAKQTVFNCLSRTSYKVDFYQREYVWSKKTVETLLDDIFYSFEQSYLVFKDSELTEDVLNKFGWYYLNVIMISKDNGTSYIVDGQQRLSTLVLLCSKLRNIVNDTDVKKLLNDCIYGKGFFKEEYYIDHDKRKRAMESIINSTSITPPFSSLTEMNLVERYKDISEYIDKKDLNDHKLRAFSYFVLYKLVLVELEIDKYEDTPMIFEVINDRGESLKPFEILKGKLVGALSKEDSLTYSDKWDSAINALPENEDKFFSTYIKSRFLTSRNSSKEMQINNEYHRYIFDDNDEAKKLSLRKQDKGRINKIKKFIDKDLKYYSSLFARMLSSTELNMRYCREIFNVESQYQLIMAACEINDSAENEKINAICLEIDRLNMLLRLNGIYESQKYQDIIYSLAVEIRGKNVSEYRMLFDDAIKKEIKERQYVVTSNVLEYNNFKKLSYNTATYFYYLFARVEDYICKNTNQTPQNDVFNMATKHSNKTGYHIEHIFSDNSTNRGYFKSEDEFNEQRNGIGGLLLLKGLDNISSGNEEYTDKLQTYSHGPIWGHTLCSEFYNANVDFNNFNAELKKNKKVEFKAYPTEFKPADMEERSKLLYELVKCIWDIQ